MPFETHVDTFLAELRPRMIAALERNAYKGAPEQWPNHGPECVRRALLSEICELHDATQCLIYPNGQLADVLDELADVANVCMILSEQEND